MTLAPEKLQPAGHADVLRASAVEDTTYLRAAINTRDWEDIALAALRARLQRAERDAVRLYFELRGMVDSHNSAMELALRALGCTLELAQTAVRAYQQVSGMDEQAAAEYCLETAKRYYAAQGKEVRVLAAGGASKLPSQGDAGSAMIPAADNGDSRVAR